MAEPRLERVVYTSSVDGTAPLYASIAYIPDRASLPIVVLMHGYTEEAAAYEQVALRWAAEQQVFVVVPEMRGRGGSAGRRDTGGVEVADILDAVEFIRIHYATQVRMNNVSLVGYGGGGGNALSCAVRFPDAFRVMVAFFPIADYAAWYYTGAGPQQQAMLRSDIGGDPQELPGAYLSRNAFLAAANNTGSKIMLFVDSEETGYPPDQHAALWIARAQAAGLYNSTLYLSLPDDEQRWLHGQPEKLQEAEPIFFPAILDPRAAPPVLPQEGRMHVPGYLITRSWECWLEDGRNGIALVEYTLGTTSGVPARWIVRPWTDRWELQVRLVLHLDRLPPARRQTQVRVLVNGRDHAVLAGGTYDLSAALGDEIRLEQVHDNSRPLGHTKQPVRPKKSKH